MNFQDQYQNQIEPLKADDTVKDDLRRRLSAEPAPRRGRPAVFRGAVALAVCAALVFTVIVAAKRENPQAPIKEANVPQTQSYSELYKAVKAFLPSPESGGDIHLFNFAKSSAANLDESQGVEDFATDNASVGDSIAPEHSETNTQVEGVDEADIVKTDGRFLYCLSTANDAKAEVRIVDLRGKVPTVLSVITLDHDTEFGSLQMYLAGDRLVVVGTEYERMAENSGSGHITSYSYSCVDRAPAGRSFLALYNVADPAAPKPVTLLTQSGYYHDSRVVGGRCYLVSDYSLWTQQIDRDDPVTYVPWVQNGDAKETVPADSVCIYDHCASADYTVVCGYDLQSGELFATRSVFGGSNTIYCSTQNLIAAGYDYNDQTQIVRFSLSEDKIEAVASTTVRGCLLNQFSIDEYKGNFRFVTTEYRYDDEDADSVNALLILDGELQMLGSIGNLAPGEQVYSVRFMGDTAYFVTFRQVDPLFSADLSDPKNPKILGALKIPGFSRYLFPFGEGKLLGIGQDADETTGRTANMKLSMFDIGDPSNVTECDKTDTDAAYAEALYNHKAAMVSVAKKLIGFSAESANPDPIYLLYTYGENGFEKLAEIKLPDNDFWQCRGLFVGDTFYIVGNRSLLYFPLDHVSDLHTLTF